MYTHTYNCVFSFACFHHVATRVATDSSNFNMQEDLRYQDRRLHKGLYLRIILCVSENLSLLV